MKVRSNSDVCNSKHGLKKIYSKALDDPYEPFDYFYKVIIIGDEKVGKSNLLLRIVKNEFKRTPKQTFGVEFEFKTIKLPRSNQTVRA